MKKKVYYKLNRYQVTKVEVETAEQEQAVKMPVSYTHLTLPTICSV